MLFLISDSTLLVLALLSSGLIFLLRLNRQWLVLLVGMVLCCTAGCQSIGSVFGRKAEQNMIQARQLANGGLEALDRGKLEQAEGCFTRALEYQPNDKRIRGHLASTYAQRGQYEDAIAHLQRIAKSSNDPAVRVELGKMYLACEQWLPAMRQAEAALSIDRKNPAAWTLKGEIEFAKGEYRSALADYQRALGLAPELKDVHLAMAETYQRLNQPMRALATLEQLLSKYPAEQEPEQVLVAKSVALMKVNQVGEAIDLLTRTSLRNNASAETYRQLCQAQVLAGKTSEARTTINRAVTLFPEQNELAQIARQLEASDQRVALNLKEVSRN